MPICLKDGLDGLGEEASALRGLGLWNVCLKIRFREAVAFARRPVCVDPLVLEGGTVEAEPVVDVKPDLSDSDPLVPAARAVGVADLERGIIAGLSRKVGFVAVGVMSSWKLGTGKLAMSRRNAISSV